MPISLLDLPSIRQAVEDLYRILEDPTPANETARRVFQWDAGRTTLGEQSPDGMLPAAFIRAGVEQVLSRLGGHTREQCPEIADSPFLVNTKAALLELRNKLRTTSVARSLARDADRRIRFVAYLAGVLGRLLPPPEPSALPAAAPYCATEPPTGDILEENGRLTMQGEIRAIRALWWGRALGEPPRQWEGPARDPQSLAELRELCLVWRSWIDEESERLLSLTVAGRRARDRGKDYSQTIRAVWRLVVRLAGEGPYPPMGDAISSTVQAVAALDRVIGWCDRQDEGGKPPADPYAGLREFARIKLKGQERAVIEALCDAAGELPIADLAVVNGVGWDDSFQGFKDAQRRLNPKLKPEGWRLERRSNAGFLVTL